MREYYVKIELSTIHENKNCGRTQTSVRICENLIFKAKALPHFFIDGVNCVMTKYNDDGSVEGYVILNEYHDKKFMVKKYNCVGDCIEGYIFTDKVHDLLIKEKIKGVDINFENNLKVINHPPIPKYSFKYQDIVITCDCCGKEITIKDFYNDDFICEKCNKDICCDFIFETIEDALKRKNKLNKNKDMEKQTKIDVLEMIQENIVRVGGKFFKQQEIYEMKVEKLIEILTANNIHIDMNIDKHIDMTIERYDKIR